MTVSRFLAPLATVVFGFLAWPVHALAKAGVRFVHAVPGAGQADLTIEQRGERYRVGRAKYGRNTDVRPLRAGAMSWSLSAGGDELASGDATLGDGRYTAVAVPRGSGVAVRLFRDAARAPRGKARVRVVHASPEFGTPDLLVDGERVVRKLAFGKATPYLTLSSGRHDLTAVRSGTDDALLQADGVRFGGNTTTNAIVIGTRGEPARVITVTDRVARRESGAGSRSTSTPARRRSGTRTVKRGDSMWSIASANLGADASSAAVSRELKRLWSLNGARIGTGDPDLIFPGQRIRLS